MFRVERVVKSVSRAREDEKVLRSVLYVLRKEVSLNPSLEATLNTASRGKIARGESATLLRKCTTEIDSGSRRGDPGPQRLLEVDRTDDEANGLQSTPLVVA